MNDKIGGLHKRLIGEKTGIIKRISYLPPGRDEPPVYISKPVTPNISKIIGANKEDIKLDTVSGKGFSVEESITTCIGETAERYCLHTPDSPSRLLNGSYRDICDDHTLIDYKFIDIHNIDEKDDIQKLNKQISLNWTSGTSIFGGGNVYIPDSLVWFRYDKEDRYLASTSNGCAAGTRFEDAVANSILEVIERDSMMRTWCLQSSPKVINDIPEELEPTLSSFNEREYEVDFFVLESSIDFPVIACLLQNNNIQYPKCVIGCSASFSIPTAMKNALAEAGQGWIFAETLLINHNIEDINNKNKYLNFKKNHIYYSCGEGSDTLLELFSNSNKVNIESLPKFGELESVLSHMNGICNPIVVDITTNDIRDAGFFVVRTLIPELIPLTLPSELPIKHPELINREVTNLPHPLA